MCQMLSYDDGGQTAFDSSCYKTYCIPDGKMVITINKVNITCDETGQTINLGASYLEYDYLTLFCPNIA